MTPESFTGDRETTSRADTSGTDRTESGERLREQLLAQRREADRLYDGWERRGDFPLFGHSCEGNCGPARFGVHYASDQVEFHSRDMDAAVDDEVKTRELLRDLAAAVISLAALPDEDLRRMQPRFGRSVEHVRRLVLDALLEIVLAATARNHRGLKSRVLDLQLMLDALAPSGATRGNSRAPRSTDVARK